MKPDFICIGAIKSGTTWLHHTLTAHPGIWMPPIKELRYFDAPETNLWERLTNVERYDYWQMQAKRFLRSPRALLHPARAAWYLHYFLAPRSPQWYARLFWPAFRRVAGEVTPLYAPLPEARIRFIKEHFPHVKIIYLLRDPIERAWSHILLRCMGLPEVQWDAGRLTEAVVRRTVLRRDLQDDWLWSNGHYAANLARWERHFSPEQIFVGFYEQLKADPQQLLTDIAGFLGVRAEPLIGAAQARQRFNRKPVTLALPPAFEARFATRYLDDLDRLADRFGPPAEAWRRRARAAAAR